MTTPNIPFADIPQPLQVALDKMREKGDGDRADICALAIAQGLYPKPNVVTEWLTRLLLEMLRMGARPTRLGLPSTVVMALWREARGLPPQGHGALPLTAGLSSSDSMSIQSAWFIGPDGTRSFAGRVFLSTPVGFVEVYASD